MRAERRCFLGLALGAMVMMLFRKLSRAEEKSEGPKVKLPEGYVPFDIGKAGATAAIEFKVGWLYREQPRQLFFRIDAPTDGWCLPSGETLGPKFKDLFKSLTGSNYLSSYVGTVHLAPHKGIRVRVTWVDQANGNVLKDEVIYRDKNGGHGVPGANNFYLDHLKLSVGSYIVRVTSLEDDPRFDGTFRTGVALGGIGWFRK